jgi:hypothetical protein
MARVEHSSRGFERERYHHRRDSHTDRMTSGHSTTTRDASGTRRDG